MKKSSNPVGWFELPVKEMKRAKAFYQQVFKVKLEVAKMGACRMAFFAMSDKTYGTAGALVEGKDYKPSTSGVLVYFFTADIEATLALAKENGGRVLLPKTSIGEYGFIGWFRDCEGNRVGLHAMK